MPRQSPQRREPGAPSLQSRILVEEPLLQKPLYSRERPGPAARAHREAGGLQELDLPSPEDPFQTAGCHGSPARPPAGSSAR